MNKPSPSLYEQVAQQHTSRFTGSYAGNVNAAVLVVSSREPSSAAKEALTASFRTLGYSNASIGWAVCANGCGATEKEQGAPSMPEGEADGSAPAPVDPEGAKAQPTAQTSLHCTTASPEPPKDGDLFTLIEAICPLCVVSLDKQAATALSHDFNAPLPLEARTLLMGHACICFQDFEALLSTSEGKHKAWNLLKQLPVC